MSGPLYGFSVYPEADERGTGGRLRSNVGIYCERCQWDHSFTTNTEVGLAELNTLATDHRKECP